MKTPANRVRRFQSCWVPSRAVDHFQLPRTVAVWLMDRASLTHRVRQACGGTFRVEVLQQGWQRPEREERAALRMRRNTLALVREVRLLCDQQAWVFARTVVPLRTLSGAQRRLSELGSQPLGALLFTDRSLQRGELELARMVPGQRLFEAATAGAARPETVWGRRSVFHVGGKPLLVQEVFLPGLGRSCKGTRR